MHVVRSTVARAAAAIEATPGTVEHATRARRRVIPRPVRRRHMTVSIRNLTVVCHLREIRVLTLLPAHSGAAARVDLTAPVKIYIIII